MYYDADFCDVNLLIKWYRFISKAGNDMPTTAPSEFGSCGTTFPIWMNGTLFLF